MKKQIAILASIIAASGFSAFGQDWISVGSSVHSDVIDDFTTPGTAVTAGVGDVDIEVLWATTGASDNFAAGSSASTGGSTAVADITALLDGGWTLAQNYGSGSGTAALGTVETGISGGANGGTKNFVANYNGSDPFEVDTASTGASGSDIQLIYIAFNAAASSYTTATAVGFSNPMLEPVGSAASDPNASVYQNAASNEYTSGLGEGVFYVDPVPEPTTLALAALGGLSMLGLRRRKA